MKRMETARNGWNGWKFLEMDGMAGHGWISLDIAGKLLEIAGHTLLEITKNKSGVASTGWK